MHAPDVARDTSRMASRVTVVLADDHPVYREGIARALHERADLELIAEAEDGHAALAAVRELQPDVALLDIRMPGLDGLDVLHAVVRDEIPTRVIFLSAFVEQEVIYEAVARGAAGYLSKRAGRDVICDALVSIARGDVAFSPEAQTALVAELQERTTEAGAVTLTPRERDVLRLTALGLSAPEIGRELSVSPATVKTHLKALYEKLGVADRAAAVAVAMRRRLIE